MEILPAAARLSPVAHGTGEGPARAGLQGAVHPPLYDKRAELLLVLDRPAVPLHNNGSEGDIREWATKRKISGSTRSDLGRRCRDTFISLKKTCRKLGISFWQYLQDRIRGGHEIVSLPDLIRQAAQEA